MLGSWQDFITGMWVGLPIFIAACAGAWLAARKEK